MSKPRLNPASSRKVRLLCSAPALYFTVLVSALALWVAFQMDAAVLKLVRKHAHGWSSWLAHQVSFWGDSFGIAAIGLLGWWQARRKNAHQWKKIIVVMGLCGVLGGLFANVIRTLSGRARPNSMAAAGWYGPAKGLAFNKSAHLGAHRRGGGFLRSAGLGGAALTPSQNPVPRPGPCPLRHRTHGLGASLGRCAPPLGRASRSPGRLGRRPRMAPLPRPRSYSGPRASG
jgi:hypothetical protein